jgi:hypothetical protein
VRECAFGHAILRQLSNGNAPLGLAFTLQKLLCSPLHLRCFLLFESFMRARC